MKELRDVCRTSAVISFTVLIISGISDPPLDSNHGFRSAILILGATILFAIVGCCHVE